VILYIKLYAGIMIYTGLPMMPFMVDECKMIKNTILLGLFLLFGCAINLSKNIEDVIFLCTREPFPLSEIMKGDFVIISANDIQINAYERSFNKEYEDIYSFGLKISKMISEEFEILTGHSARVANRMENLILTDRERKEKLAARNEEFSVIIKKVLISEETVWQSNYNSYSDRDTGSFSRYCTVDTAVEIWNNITLEKLSTFIAHGRTEVSFIFVYRPSLRNAVEESCRFVAEVLAGKYKPNHH